MDYSAANPGLWNPILQLGIIAIAILVANLLRRKIPAIRSTLLPAAVLGGFLLLIIKLLGIVSIDKAFMEMLVYHCIAIGFIAMTLRVPEERDKAKGQLTGLKSGAVIVSSYMIQGVLGLVITLILAHTFMPGLFEAAGILLPMGYGQGPGQANNIGFTYEALGFAGGRSFGLAIAATGYIVACVVGVIYVNMLVRQGKVQRIDSEDLARSATVEDFQHKDEAPVSESIDRFTIQVCLVAIVYLVTFLATWGLTSFLTAVAPGVGATVNTLLWGFNFIVGSAIALLARIAWKKMKNGRIMTRQYQNNYLLSRISGMAFDIMIVAGIASIELEDLSGLWVPFLLLVVLGAVVTLFHLKFVCKRVYGDYYYEGLVSMYGMMTGTISSGILLLREIDPQFSTPAANNLVIGSSFGILLGIPILILVGLAPKSTLLCVITIAICAAYYAILLWVIFLKPRASKKQRAGSTAIEE